MEEYQMVDSYVIVRTYPDKFQRTVVKGLSLGEAKEYCKRFKGENNPWHDAYMPDLMYGEQVKVAKPIQRTPGSVFL